MKIRRTLTQINAEKVPQDATAAPDARKARIKEYQSYMAQFRSRCFEPGSWHYRYVRGNYLNDLARIRRYGR